MYQKLRKPKLQRPKAQWPLPVLVTEDEEQEEPEDFKSSATKLLESNRGEKTIAELQEIIAFEALEYFLFKKGLLNKDGTYVQE